MSAHRRAKWVVILIALCGSPVWAQGAEGQPPAASASNFVFAPDQKTCELGSLGHVEKIGSGPIHLILLPGAAFGWESWKPFMERNADRYTMHAFTPAGYGGTNPPPLPENPEDFTDEPWTRAFLEAVHGYVMAEKIERPVLVGHHLMGGYYAVRLAIEHPEAYAGAASVWGEPTRPLMVSSGPAQQANMEATQDEMVAHVHKRWVPFFRSVSESTWRTNTYAPDKLSTNPDHGQRLYDEQVSVPLSIQLRYFLEFMCDNIVPQARQMATPTLVVWPAPDSAKVYEQFVQMMMSQGGLDRATAQARVDSTLAAQFGSKEEGLKMLSTNPWTPISSKNANVRIESAPASGVFVMDDQAEWFDQTLAKFVEEVTAH